MASDRPELILGDDERAPELLGDVLAKLFPLMAENSSVLVFTSFQREPEFRAAIQDAGFRITSGVIWPKSRGGPGDCEVSFLPRHERIIHAVRGRPRLDPRLPDVLEGKELLDTEHPTTKPLDLLRKIIESSTQRGDIVADPFCGSGATVVAAMDVGRQFWACELSERWYRETVDRVRTRVVEMLDANGGDV